VGIAGFVGVLSGMVPGAYSVTINWAPPVVMPGWDFGPAFLLRRVLESCDTYEQAVADLSTVPLASSVFYVVCGAKKGQACVVERTRTKAAVREYRGKPLVQANHHVARQFRSNNWGMYQHNRYAYNDSWHRARALGAQLARRTQPRKLNDTLKPLMVEPVLGMNTQQLIAFCPSRGRVAVLRSTNTE
jgi:hypothetical protein